MAAMQLPFHLPDAPREVFHSSGQLIRTAVERALHSLSAGRMILHNARLLPPGLVKPKPSMAKMIYLPSGFSLSNRLPTKIGMLRTLDKIFLLGRSLLKNRLRANQKRY